MRRENFSFGRNRDVADSSGNLVFFLYGAFIGFKAFNMEALAVGGFLAL